MCLIVVFISKVFKLVYQYVKRTFDLIAFLDSSHTFVKLSCVLQTCVVHAVHESKLRKIMNKYWTRIDKTTYFSLSFSLVLSNDSFFFTYAGQHLERVVAVHIHHW